MITAFVPCRAGSERVKNKNTRLFAGREGGLLQIKIEQLLATKFIDSVIISTNDESVMEIASKYIGFGSKLSIDKRPEHLCLSSTSTDELIEYVPSIISEGSVLWTHVTSPFVSSFDYNQMIDQHLVDLNDGSYDSLMAVTELKTFIWNEEGPVNYDSSVEKWPRTQTLKPLYEVNSAAFIIDVKIMAAKKDRVGYKLRLVPLDKKTSFDIDWPDDFDLAEMMWVQINNVDLER